MEGDTPTMQEIFAFDFGAGVDAEGRFRGTTRPTGIRPRFTDRFDDLGIALDLGVFQLEGAPA
jgi:pilus assembly protein CpaF